MNGNSDKSGMVTVLVVDDDIYLLAAIRQTLMMHGHAVQTFDKAADVLDALGADRGPFVVLADVKMPKIDGLMLLERLKILDRELPVIMMTGHGDIAMAVSAMKKGAYDFLEKPVDEDVMLASLGRAIDKARLVSENRRLNERLRSATESRACFHGLIGRHPVMQHLYDVVEIVAREDDTAFIQGETGTGKELVARAIHNLSRRRNQPFVAVNMGAIPAEMMEAELFGYQKGAFTGATQTKIGKFEYAGEGSLFLDEICSLPITLQAKLLRVLEDKTISRLGNNAPIPMRARIITATNRDLAQEITKGAFRQDLYFRLNVLPVNVPALRDRKIDIPLLAEYFFGEYCRDRKLDLKPLEPSAIHQMTQMDWPGNVRELRNYVRRLCIFGPECIPVIKPEKTESGVVVTDDLPLRLAVEEAEKEHILATLRKYHGTITAAYAVLGISRKCLYDKINKYKIDVNSLREKS